MDRPALDVEDQKAAAAEVEATETPKKRSLGWLWAIVAVIVLAGLVVFGGPA